MDVFQFVIGEPPITDPRTLSPVHDRLRVRHLRLLEALERSENLGQEAEELGITQSAATKILQDAEELLGLPLFERRHRGMAPTEIGRFVIGYARRILNDTKGFLDGLSALKRGGYGFLSVGAIMAITPGILPAAIAELKRRRPLLTISLVATKSDRFLAALGDCESWSLRSGGSRICGSEANSTSSSWPTRSCGSLSARIMLSRHAP